MHNQGGGVDPGHGNHRWTIACATCRSEARRSVGLYIRLAAAGLTAAASFVELLRVLLN